MILMMMMIVAVNDNDDDSGDQLPLFHRKVKDLPSERVTGQLDPDVREEKVGIVLKRMIMMMMTMMMMMMMMIMMVLRCYYMAYQRI